MKVNHWKYKSYDLAANVGANLYLCFKIPDYEDSIIRQPIRIGIYGFVPGTVYTKFGSKKKTSSGYLSVECPKDTGFWFIGTFNDPERETNYLLFRKSVNGEMRRLQRDLFGKTHHGYHDIFFCYMDLECGALMTLNMAGSGRVIEMDR